MITSSGDVFQLDGNLGFLAAATEALSVANQSYVDAQPAMTELSARAYNLKTAFSTLTDKTAREFYDKPCTPIFGACCAKDTDGGGKDIKCGGDFENAE